MLATVADDDLQVAFLAERQVPFACFGRTNPARPQHWVDIDNRAAIRDVTARVLARGHTASPTSATSRREGGTPSGKPVIETP